MSSNDIKSLSYEIKELSKEMYKRYSEHMSMDDIANIAYSVMCTYANDIKELEEFDRIENKEPNKLYLINVYDTNMTNFYPINQKYFKTQADAREAILQYIRLWIEEKKYKVGICLNKTRFTDGDDMFVFEVEGKLYLKVRGRYVTESTYKKSEDNNED